MHASPHIVYIYIFIYMGGYLCACMSDSAHLTLFVDAAVGAVPHRGVPAGRGVRDHPAGRGGDHTALHEEDETVLRPHALGRGRGHR